MKIQLFPYQLFYQFPFKIAHTMRTYTDVLYVQLIDGEDEAWGEAVFPPYVTENIKEAIDFFTKLIFPLIVNEESILTFLTDFLSKNKNQHPAKCAALEMAILRLLAIKRRKSLAQFLNIQLITKEISVTLSISSKEVLKQKIIENSTASYFKLKVSEDSIADMIEFYTSYSQKPFVIDANQGFKNKEKALFWAKEMRKMNVAYFEQPFDKHDLEGHLWLKSQNILPIIADESFQNREDIPKILPCFDGINIKLMKCGGFSEAKKIISIVKKQDKKVILGCMSDSSVSIEIAQLLNNQVDFSDLDGPLLMKNDPILHHNIDIYEKGVFERFLLKK